MSIDNVIDFLKWCMILNFSLYIFSLSIFMLLSDFGYNLHKRLGFFEGNKVQHKQIVFVYFGVWKLIVIVFNLVPYLALKIIF